MRGGWILVSVFAAVSGLAGGTFYVDGAHPRASDSGPGSEAVPWRTVGQAAETLEPGDTVLIQTGLYREWVRPLRSGTPGAPITYAAAPGARVVLTGLDVTTGWEPDSDGVWRLDDWSHRFLVAPGRDYHPGDPSHRETGRAEQVRVDGTPFRQVFARDKVKPGTFFADTSGQGLYVGLPAGQDARDHKIEAGTRGYVFGINPWRRPEGVDHIHVRGLIIRHASNHAQRGALSVVGNHWVVENVLVEETNGAGWSFRGSGHEFHGITSRCNGQLGARGEGTDFLLAGCRFIQNNTKGYSPGWEAGGIKISDSRNARILGCDFIGNNGPGLWLDIDNRHALVEDCLVVDNAGQGIYVEISGWCTIRNNACLGNGVGTGNEVRGWGSAGITIAESRNCLVTHNLCAFNRDGIAVREGGPRSLVNKQGEETTWVSENNTFSHNILAENHGYAFAYWSDNNFFGKHPNHKGPLTEADLRENPAYDPMAMGFTIDKNLYWPPGGTDPILLWGAPWREKSRTFATLAAIRGELGFDQDSIVADPRFRDTPADLRLAPDSPALRAGIGLRDQAVLERMDQPPSAGAEPHEEGG